MNLIHKWFKRHKQQQVAQWAEKLPAIEHPNHANLTPTIDPKQIPKTQHMQQMQKLFKILETPSVIKMQRNLAEFKTSHDIKPYLDWVQQMVQYLTSMQDGLSQLKNMSDKLLDTNETDEEPPTEAEMIDDYLDRIHQVWMYGKQSLPINMRLRFAENYQNLVTHDNIENLVQIWTHRYKEINPHPQPRNGTDYFKFQHAIQYQATTEVYQESQHQKSAALIMVYLWHELIGNIMMDYRPPKPLSDMIEHSQTQSEVVDWILIWGHLKQAHQSKYVMSWDQYRQLFHDPNTAQFIVDPLATDIIAYFINQWPTGMCEYEQITKTSMSYTGNGRKVSISHSVRNYNYLIEKEPQLAYQKSQTLPGLNPLNNWVRLMRSKYITNELKQQSNQVLRLDVDKNKDKKWHLYDADNGYHLVTNSNIDDRILSLYDVPNDHDDILLPSWELKTQLMNVFYWYYGDKEGDPKC